MAWQIYGQRPLLCESVLLLPGPYPGVRRCRRGLGFRCQPDSKPPLCKGRWHGVAMTEGLFAAPSGLPGLRWPGSGHIPPSLRPWKWKGNLPAEQAHPRDVIRHLCDLSRPRADYGPIAQNNIKPLGFQKGRAPFVAFCPFWPLKMDPQRGASPPGWQACPQSPL